MHIKQYYHTSQHKYTKICQIVRPTIHLFYTTGYCTHKISHQVSERV